MSEKGIDAPILHQIASRVLPEHSRVGIESKSDPLLRKALAEALGIRDFAEPIVNSAPDRRRVKYDDTKLAILAWTVEDLKYLSQCISEFARALRAQNGKKALDNARMELLSLYPHSLTTSLGTTATESEAARSAILHDQVLSGEVPDAKGPLQWLQAKQVIEIWSWVGYLSREGLQQYDTTYAWFSAWVLDGILNKVRDIPVNADGEPIGRVRSKLR